MKQRQANLSKSDCGRPRITGSFLPARNPWPGNCWTSYGFPSNNKRRITRCERCFESGSNPLATKNRIGLTVTCRDDNP